MSTKTTDLAKKLFLEIHKHYLPNKVALIKSCDDIQVRGQAGQTLALLEDKNLVSDKPAVFICRNFTCDKAIVEAEELAHKLNKLAITL
jgi:uncharacterized protein YyaL (SSP411 family)